MRSTLSDLLSQVQSAKRAADARMAVDAAAKGMDVNEYEAMLLERERARAEESGQIVANARRNVIDRYGHLVPRHMHEPFIAGDIADTKALAAVRQWLGSDSPKPILVLLGGTGTGKTLASFTALATLRGQLVEAVQLGRRADPWRNDIDAGVEALDLTTGGLLVLDDLGTEDADDKRFFEAFGRLVNVRQGTKNGRPLRTLITTNIPSTDIRRRYGDRVADRFNEVAKAVPLEGASMRKAGV